MTKTYTTSQAAYTALDAGPCLLELYEPGIVRVHVGTTLPAVGITAYHVLSYPAGAFTYNGTETVYVLSDTDANPDVVATHIV